MKVKSTESHRVRLATSGIGDGGCAVGLQCVVERAVHNARHTVAARRLDGGSGSSPEGSSASTPPLSRRIHQIHFHYNFDTLWFHRFFLINSLVLFYFHSIIVFCKLNYGNVSVLFRSSSDLLKDFCLFLFFTYFYFTSIMRPVVA